MIIVQDTREKTPWRFEGYECVNEVQVFKLNEGDYTTLEILELERATGRKILRIERKSGTPELAINMGRKRTTFEKELKRLSEYEHKYLIMEFDEDDLYLFPKYAGIPDKQMYKTNKDGKRVRRIKMNGPYMVSTLKRYAFEYGIKLIYACNRERAIEKAIEVMNADFQKIPE